MLTCFVDQKGKVHDMDLRERRLRYEFDLERRTMILAAYGTPFPTDSSHDKAASKFFNDLVGTPERLMTFVKEANLSKLELTKLLNLGARNFYLDVCAGIEKSITEACTAQNDPCLEDGCALEGQICLNACLTADRLYYGQCTSIWLEFFKSPANRIDTWRS